MTNEVRRIRFSAGARGEASRLVRDVLEARGFTETTDPDWNVYWDVGIPDTDAIQMSGPHRLLNRFPGIGALGSKYWLHRTLSDARNHLSHDGLDSLLDITPQTFALPEEYALWQDAARRHPDRLWIRKPKEGSRGHGVALVESTQDLAADASLIVQEYISHPRLIEGRKFTLRFYVLVTSLVPLVAYVHEDGFVKLASRPFSVAPEHRADRFRHLTNPDVLRHDTDRPASGDNLSHRAYRALLRAEGADADAVWASIVRALAATLMAARGVMARVQARDAAAAMCFELLGCDVTLDQHLRPFLLECNYAPSLSVEAAPEGPAAVEEHQIKRRVIDDTFAIVEAGHLSEGHDSSSARAETRLRRELAHRGGFNLIVPSPTSLPLAPVFARIEPADVQLLPLAISERVPEWTPGISPEVVSAVLDGRCVLGHRQRRDLYVLDVVASAIWSGFEEGLAPRAIAAEIAYVTDADAARVEVDVWASLMEWLVAGLLVGTPDAAPPEAARAARPRGEENVVFAFMAALQDVDAGTVVRIGAPAAAERVFVRCDGDGMAYLAREDGAAVHAVAYEWPTEVTEGTWRVVSPAEGLQRLLTDASAAPLVVDASAAWALAELAGQATWRVPLC